jgi:cysteine desulfurase / selenocysteine lyase
MTQSVNNENDLRHMVMGVDQPVPLWDGTIRPYVNLDNAASTPPFVHVKEKVDEAMQWYSSVHRGSGFKSLLSTHLYDEAREVLAHYLGADLQTETVIFGKNASEAINKLANRFPFQPGDIVLTSVMEHHSNDLPWRAKAPRVLYTGIRPDGSLDMEDLQTKLEHHAGKIKLVAITGASNVTGYLPPIYDIAEMAHHYGAMFMVDAAQLFPHRKINMGPSGSPRHLDFIALAGHKVYAPFGTGALVGPKEFFNQGEPDYRGGGTIDLVTLDEVRWADTPDRDEAGSPNVIGAIALAAAVRQIEEIGMDHLAEHEKNLTRHALQKLNAIPGIRIFGSSDPDRLEDRLGVITFQVGDLNHGKVAAILSFEGAIGVRNGCFCAHPYVLRLLQVSDEEFQKFRQRVIHKDRSDLPGMVRASFGCYNNLSDIDCLAEMLQRILGGDYGGDYVLHARSGSYYPRDFELKKMENFFQF